MFKMLMYELTLYVYLSGKDFPHLLHLRGLSEVWSFCTCIRRSVLRPHVVGHNSHWNTGLSPAASNSDPKALIKNTDDIPLG